MFHKSIDSTFVCHNQSGIRDILLKVSHREGSDSVTEYSTKQAEKKTNRSQTLPKTEHSELILGNKHCPDTKTRQRNHKK